MQYTIDDKTIEGWRKVSLSLGLDSDRSAIVAVQIEDSIELWETDGLYGWEDDIEAEQVTIRALFNFFADTEYCEPDHIVRWWVMKLHHPEELSYNRSWRGNGG